MHVDVNNNNEQSEVIQQAYQEHHQLETCSSQPIGYKIQYCWGQVHANRGYHQLGTEWKLEHKWAWQP